MSSLPRPTLKGEHVTLTPLELEDVDALARVGLDPRIWAWSPFPVETAADLTAYVESALAEQDAQVALPFATRLTKTGAIIGSTRFCGIALSDLRAEIGWTWLSPDHWRTGANVEAKLLMLGFAFETLGLRRVELKTDERNERSRNAMERLGAKFEGILRKHMVRKGGDVRNSAYYSILDDEWPEVKEALARRLESH